MTAQPDTAIDLYTPHGAIIAGMRGPLRQAGHIAYEVGYFLISLISCVYVDKT